MTGDQTQAQLGWTARAPNCTSLPTSVVLRYPTCPFSPTKAAASCCRCVKANPDSEDALYDIPFKLGDELHLLSMRIETTACQSSENATISEQAGVHPEDYLEVRETWRTTAFKTSTMTADLGRLCEPYWVFFHLGQWHALMQPVSFQLTTSEVRCRSSWVELTPWYALPRTSRNMKTWFYIRRLPFTVSRNDVHAARFHVGADQYLSVWPHYHLYKPITQAQVSLGPPA
ncbi:hypothetical protein DFH09DRAFT_1285006 [Mycena vulgaris]|nr:hypothetical protein DFH09DRAFT_1285006 [Mycena vulgaris]